MPPFGWDSMLCCNLPPPPFFRAWLDCPPVHLPIPPASTSRPSASLTCLPRPATQCPSRPLKSCAAGPFLPTLPSSIFPPLFHPQHRKRPCWPHRVLRSTGSSFRLRFPHPLPSPVALDLPPRAPVGPKEFRAASLRFSYSPASVRS